MYVSLQLCRRDGADEYGVEVVLNGVRVGNEDGLVKCKDDGWALDTRKFVEGI